MRTQELLNRGSEFLKENKILSNKLDSEIILSHILGVSRERILIDEISIDEKKIREFNTLILRRSKKEPIAYIIKNKEFRSTEFFVDENSLIPRPETELLIDPILSIFKRKKIFFLDVGIGTGCIILSILKELKNSKGIGIDSSKKTLINARKNLLKFNFSNRAKLLHKSINDTIKYKFDLIVSNPPYVTRREINYLPEDIRKFEPRLALDGGNDGLDVIKKVIYKSNYILKKNGILALEIGNGQQKKVFNLLRNKKFRICKTVKDYKDNIRCIFSTLL